MNLHIHLFELFSVTGDIDIDMDKVTNTGIYTDTDMDMNIASQNIQSMNIFAKAKPRLLA